jgi:hypothetical protein
MGKDLRKRYQKMMLQSHPHTFLGDENGSKYETKSYGLPIADERIVVL